MLVHLHLFLAKVILPGAANQSTPFFRRTVAMSMIGVAIGTAICSNAFGFRGDRAPLHVAPAVITHLCLRHVILQRLAGMEILFGRLCGCGRWQSAGDGDEAGGGLGARAGAGRAGIANHGSSDEGGGGKGKGLMPQARELGRKDGQEASGRNRSHGRRHLFWRSADGAREGEGAEHVKGRRRRVAHLGQRSRGLPADLDLRGNEAEAHGFGKGILDGLLRFQHLVLRFAHVLLGIIDVVELAFDHHGT
mmetsp:Transcript_64392/g.150935  ORF Transcript_64392/g.150935 Transcript_64392/m.150935 type:complete len:249 (-) Transcript_64392:235-981(-)